MLNPELITRLSKSGYLLGCYDGGYIICDAYDNHGQEVFLVTDVDFVSAVVVMLREGLFADQTFFVAVQTEDEAVQEIENLLETEGETT